MCMYRSLQASSFKVLSINPYVCAHIHVHTTYIHTYVCTCIHVVRTHVNGKCPDTGNNVDRYLLQLVHVCTKYMYDVVLCMYNQGVTGTVLQTHTYHTY